MMVFVETKIDKFGRVVIPKSIREHLGLAPGTAVTVVESGDHLVVAPTSAVPLLEVKDDVLVYGGTATGNLVDAVDRLRSGRVSDLLDT